MKRINKTLFKQIIAENREFITQIPDTYVKRDCFQVPEKIKKVIILYGVRRSGKTYMLYHLMKQSPGNSLYIDFEDERLDDFSTEDFETLREAFFELYPTLADKKVLFLFDEIQVVEGWEKFCRRLVERTRAEVIIAGSSSRIHPENISTTLRGRSWSIEVFPFSFKEFAGFRGIEPNAELLISGDRFRVVELFDEYIKWGGFPEVTAAASEFEKRKIIKEYLDAMLFKDLVERYNISNITLLQSLKSKIFSTFSTKFSLGAFYNKLKGSFPFSKDLLYRYYQHLVNSNIVFDVRKFSDSEYDKSRNPGKVYLIDPSLSLRVVHDASARVLENIVFIELLRRHYKPHYFHLSSECDFVGVRDEGIELFQVTYKLEEGNRAREFNGLLDAARFVGLPEGYILTYNEEGEQIIDNIKVKIIPAWKWLLGLV